MNEFRDPFYDPSKPSIDLNGYIIDPDAMTIDFSAIPDFNPALLDSIMVAQGQTQLFVNPRFNMRWGTWDGKVFRSNHAPGTVAHLGRGARLLCRYTPGRTIG